MKSIKAYGILNAFGELWTNETFSSPEKAREYIHAWEESTKQELPNHRPVRVRVTPLKD